MRTALPLLHARPTAKDLQSSYIATSQTSKHRSPRFKRYQASICGPRAKSPADRGRAPQHQRASSSSGGSNSASSRAGAYTAHRPDSASRGACCGVGPAAARDRPAAQTPLQQPAAPGSMLSSLQDSIAAAFRGNKHDAAILALALPSVVALAADPLLSIVDTAFVGRAGPDALAALGVNSALFTFAFIVFNFLGTATTPLVASSLAAGDNRRAGKVTMQALAIALVLGGALAASLVLGSEGALALMGAGPETGGLHDLAKEFLLIRALAAPAALIMTVGQGTFRGMQDMRTPLAVAMGANAINLGLDCFLILGLGWGVGGAAIATTSAEWVAAAAYLFLLWRRRDTLGGLDLSDVLGGGAAAEAAQEFLPFLLAGGAVLLRTGLLLGTKTLASATAARLGTVPIAAHQVVMQLWLLFSLLMDSLAVAGQSLVAVQVGQGHVGEARAVANRLLQLGVGVGAALALACWAAEPLIPGVFSSDQAVDAAVAQVLPIAVGLMPANAAVYVLDGILVGARDFSFMAGAMGIAAASGAGMLLTVQPMGLGLMGVWGALAALQLSRLGTLVWRYQDQNGPVPPLKAAVADAAEEPADLTKLPTQQTDRRE